MGATSRFETPEDILRDTELGLAQKLDALRRWEFDQRELAVAVQEGMPGPEPELLSRIARARSLLVADPGPERGPPTATD